MSAPNCLSTYGLALGQCGLDLVIYLALNSISWEYLLELIKMIGYFSKGSCSCDAKLRDCRHEITEMPLCTNQVSSASGEHYSMHRLWCH